MTITVSISAAREQLRGTTPQQRALAQAFIYSLYTTLHRQELETPERIEACNATGRYPYWQCCTEHRLLLLEASDMGRRAEAAGSPCGEQVTSPAWWRINGIDLLGGGDYVVIE